MPELTPKLGIKKPLGNETVSRAAFNENWDIIDAMAQKNITQGPTAPANPTEGDLWIDTSTSPNVLKRYAGGAWVQIGAVTPADIGAASQADLEALQTDLAAHLAETAPHGATSAATANRLILRDTAGRAKVAAPSAADDIARKDTVDAHANRTDNPHTTTAAQVGALVSVDGVSNAGGNIDLVAGLNIAITPDDANNQITIAGTGTWPNADSVDNLHVTGSSTPGLRKITTSTADPSGGNDGDIWIKYV